MLELPRIGAHLPVSKGLRHVIDEAQVMGLEALQIFLRNPRGMKARELSSSEIEYFQEKANNLDISPIAVHIPYICNPASVKEDIYQLAHRVITEDLARCDIINADYLVLHPGSYTVSSPDKAINRLIELLKRVLEGYRGTTEILIETMSGQGSEIGRNFEEIGQILKGVGEHPRVGVCLDTCHLFAAGYNIADAQGLKSTLEELSAYVGTDKVRMVHVNDSLGDLGSKKDRHAHIGQGKIGERGFYVLCQHPFLRRFPFVLETEYSGIPRDVEVLKRLRSSTGDG